MTSGMLEVRECIMVATAETESLPAGWLQWVLGVAS